MPSDTPRAAHRNDSFWQISMPPIWRKSIGKILPGYGAAKATRCFCATWLVYTVVNSDSPVTRRLPAPSSLPKKPPPPPPEPSPNTVSIEMPASMKNRLPASPTAASPGSSSISTNCISEPLIS